MVASGGFVLRSVPLGRRRLVVTGLVRVDDHGLRRIDLRLLRGMLDVHLHRRYRRRHPVHQQGEAQEDAQQERPEGHLTTLPCQARWGIYVL